MQNVFYVDSAGTLNHHDSQYKHIYPNDPLILEYLGSVKEMAIDTETSGLDCHSDNVLLASFGNDEIQFVWNLLTTPVSSKLKEVIESKEVLKVLHNAKFDYKMFRKLGIIMENIYDTMLSSQLIYNGYMESHSLENVLKRELQFHFSETLSKSIRNSFIGKISSNFTTQQIMYSALDVEKLLELKDALNIKISTYNLNTVLQLELDACLAFGDMEYNGFYIDDQYMKTEVIPYLKGKINKYKNALDDEVINLSKWTFPELSKYVIKNVSLDLFTGEPIGVYNKKLKGYNYIKTTINWNSPKQIITLLTEMGLDTSVIDKKTGGSKQSADDSVLARYASEAMYNTLKEKGLEDAESLANNLFDYLLLYRGYTKADSTYGTNLLDTANKVTGRIHSSFNQLGTATGRLSSKEPNLQNIPAKKLFRNAFKVQRGGKMMTLDYSGAELRIIAHAAQEPTMMKALQEGLDLHSYLATIAFGVEVSKTVNKEKRTQMKTVNFGIAYGASGQKFADLFGSAEAAQDFLDNKYFAAFPNLKSYLDSSANTAAGFAYSVTLPPYNRIRWFPKVLEWKEYLDADDKALRKEAFKHISAAKREGMNAPIQGCCADIVKAAVIKFREWTITNGFFDKVLLVCQVHDELVFEVDKSLNAEIIFDSVKKLMVTCAEEIITSVPMEVEGEISDCWTK